MNYCQIRYIFKPSNIDIIVENAVFVRIFYMHVFSSL